MPNATKEWARRRKRAEREQNARAAENPEIVEQIQKEAKAAGATLAHGGQGGLDPRLALEVFRKAKWRCANPWCPTPQKDLDLDHIGGHPKEIFEDSDTKDQPKLREGAKAGKKNDEFLHCLCVLCHDAVHDRERALEEGKEPKPMRGTA